MPLDRSFGTDDGEAFHQQAAGIGRSDGKGAFEEHGAFVHALRQQHQRDAGLVFAVENGVLDRRRSAVLRKQRGVNVPGVERRCLKNLDRKNTAVRHHDREVDLETAQTFGDGAVTELARLLDGETVVQGERLDRGWLELLAAALRSIGLADHQRNVVLVGLDQAREHRSCDIGRAEKGETKPAIRQREAVQARTSSFAFFLSFFFTSDCLSRERRSTKRTPSR